MMILGTFAHSLELEQALNELEREGIPRRHLLVVCMDTEPRPPLPEVIRSREPRSKEIETGFACATGLAVVGASVGFALPLGPILCGLLAAVLGFGLGFGMQSLYLNQTRHIVPLPRKLPEVTIVVQCEEQQCSRIDGLLWRFGAITVGRTNAGS